MAGVVDHGGAQRKNPCSAGENAHAQIKSRLESLKKCKIPGIFQQERAERPVFPAYSSIVTLVRIKGALMATQLSKSQLVERISTATELSKRDVKNVMDTLVDVGHKELKKNGIFLVPGFAKFVVVKKPATKARKGTNPFTGEEMMFKAKPARKIVRARPVKAAKDAV
jgi:nucleoid DNA-binding protein